MKYENMPSIESDMQIYFSQNVRYFLHRIWKNSVLMELSITEKIFPSTTLEWIIFDPKVVIVNSEISSHVTQRGGIVSVALDLVKFQEK